MIRVAVVGAGAVGRLLARALSERGDRVALLSPEPVEAPAFWMSADAVTGRGLKLGLAGAEVVVYAAAGQRGRAIEDVGIRGAEQVCRAAQRAGIQRVLMLGPAGASSRAKSRHLQAHAFAVEACARRVPDLKAVGLPPLFGRGDHLVTPWLARAERGRPIHVHHGKLELRPLWVGDARTLLLAAVDGRLPDRVSVQGPERLTVSAMAGKLCARYGVGRTSLGRARRPGADEVACMKEQLGAPDGWEALELGARSTFDQWLVSQPVPEEN